MVAERGVPRKNVQSYQATDSIANEEATSEFGRVHRSREISTTRSSRECCCRDTGEALPSRSIFPSHFQPRNWLRPGHIVSLGSLTSCWAFRFGGMALGPCLFHSGTTLQLEQMACSCD